MDLATIRMPFERPRPSALPGTRPLFYAIRAALDILRAIIDNVIEMRENNNIGRNILNLRERFSR